eukprot:6195945-Pleurochrysis_carterae.AAC.1
MLQLFHINYYDLLNSVHDHARHVAFLAPRQAASTCSRAEPPQDRVGTMNGISDEQASRPLAAFARSRAAPALVSVQGSSFQTQDRAVSSARSHIFAQCFRLPLNVFAEEEGLPNDALVLYAPGHQKPGFPDDSVRVIRANALLR